MQAMDGVKQRKAFRRQAQNGEPHNNSPENNNFASTENCYMSLPVRTIA
jgi:hypothetical protein